MNAAQANNLNLIEVMSALGFEPVKVEQGRQRYWYKSPFREEKEASLNISPGKKWAWVWNDFGDEGGTTIDLICKLKNYNVSQALSYLDTLKGISVDRVGDHNQGTLNFNPTRIVQVPDKLKLKTVRSLKKMFGYITTTRKISRTVAALYLKDVDFTNTQNGKDYFAAGIQNIAGGWEIRNPYFKAVIGPKNITLIKGEDPTQVFLFEGFMDFLSALTDQPSELQPYISQNQFTGDVLILNSASFKKAMLQEVEKNGYRFIGTFFDNDRAGEELRAAFDQSTKTIVHFHSVYQGYKDYNAYLVLN